MTRRPSDPSTSPASHDGSAAATPLLDPTTLPGAATRPERSVPPARGLLLQALYERCNDAMILADPATGRIIDVNRRAEHLTGYTCTELRAMHIGALTPPGDSHGQLEALAGDRSIMVRAEIRTKTGRRVPVEVSVRVIEVGGRSVIQGVLRDATQQSATEAALRESERRFRDLFEASPDAIFVEDLDGNVLDVNPAACRLHGVLREALVGLNVRDLVPREQRTAAMRDFEQLARGEVTTLQSYSWTVNDHAVPVEIRANHFIYDGRRALLLIVRDVSERRALEREVLRISDDERQRIGQDIHDGLASQFSGIALLGRGLVNRLDSGRPVDRETLEEVANLARAGSEQARALARGLSPVQLGEEGLKAALHELARSAEVLAGLAYTFEMDDLPIRLDSSVTTQLYRIVQEAVHNALKHAGATRIEVCVRARDGQLVLSVRDDGRGLPEQRDASSGMGLHVMLYRARMVGATLRIDAAPGAGTRVTCSLPLPDAVPSA